MRDAPSVQSEFHRVGRIDPPASGSGVPDIKTHPSSSSGPLPAAGPLSAQSVQDVCTDTCVKVPYSACSTVIGQSCPQRVAVPSHTVSGPSVPGFRIRRPSEDLVSQSAVQSVSSCQSESAEQSVVGHQHGPGPFGLQSPSDSQVPSGACSTVTSAVACDPPVPFPSVTPDPPAIPPVIRYSDTGNRIGPVAAPQACLQVRGSPVLPAHPPLQRANVRSNAVSGSEVPGVKASSIPARPFGLQLLTKNGGMRYGRCISSPVSADNKCDNTPRVVDVLPVCADVTNNPDLGNLGQQTPHPSTESRQYSRINNIYVAPHFAPVSSTVSRQISAIFSRQRATVIYSTLNPKAVPFCPRVTYSVASAAATPEPPASTSVMQSPDTVVLPMPSQLMPPFVCGVCSSGHS